MARSTIAGAMPGNTERLSIEFDSLVPAATRPEIERLLRTAIESSPEQHLSVSVSRAEDLRWTVRVEGRPARDLEALLDSALRYLRG